MKNNNLTFKAKEYLFHLNNANNENGIRQHEGWKFLRTDLAGRQAIEHGYNPVVSTEVNKSDVESFTQLVMRGIDTEHRAIKLADTHIEAVIGADQFVAYCTHRPRR